MMEYDPFHCLDKEWNEINYNFIILILPLSARHVTVLNKEIFVIIVSYN